MEAPVCNWSVRSRGDNLDLKQWLKLGQGDGAGAQCCRTEPLPVDSDPISGETVSEFSELLGGIRKPPHWNTRKVNI